MVNCPSCGAANTDGAVKCVACDHAIQLICPKCGCNNSLTASVCNQCGATLENTNIKEEEAKTINDPVAEMFEPVHKNQISSWPKRAIIMLVSALLIFTLLFLTKISESHPLVWLVGGLICGIVALIALIELFFWFIDEKKLIDGGLDLGEKIDNDFPEDLSLEAVNPLASLKESDKDLESSSKASSKLSTLEMGTPIEAVPEQTEKKSPSVDKHYETLAEFLDDGISTEIAEIKEKLSKTPNNYALMLRLAQLNEERADTDGALANLESCVAHNPDSAEVYLYYGTMLRQKGRLLEAQKALEKSLELNKFMSKAYYQLGLLQKAQNRYEYARDMFQKAIQLSPDDPYAHYQLGMTYKVLGKTDLAIMEVKRATILHPTDSYGHSRLGQFYQEQKKYNQAITSYSMAISLSPKDAFVLEKLAEVLAAKGEHNRARYIPRSLS